MTEGARGIDDAPFGRGRYAAAALGQVIKAAVWVGCRTPARLAHALATVGGTLEWALRPAKRERLAQNLAHAAGEPPTSRRVRRLVRREIRNEAHRSADLLWALGKQDEFLETTSMPGIELAQRTVEEGNGLILAGIHIGGWEVATAVPANMFRAPVSVVVADDWLARAIEHARVAAGLNPLYPTHAAAASVRRLRRGEIILLLADDSRFATRRQPVRFLDGEIDIAAGVATLARLGQAPVVIFNVLPEGPRRWRVEVDPPIPPPPKTSGEAGEQELLQRLADRWSEVIRAHPEHWSASHPIEWR